MKFKEAYSLPPSLCAKKLVYIISGIVLTFVGICGRNKRNEGRTFFATDSAGNLFMSF